MADIEPYLQRLVDRFASPAVQKKMKGFTRTLQFRFTDTGQNWLIRTVDGKEVTLSRETIETPNIVVAITTDDLARIMDKSINPVTAYMQGRIRVTGDMQDLMRLGRVML